VNRTVAIIAEAKTYFAMLFQGARASFIVRMLPLDRILELDPSSTRPHTFVILAKGFSAILL